MKQIFPIVLLASLLLIQSCGSSDRSSADPRASVDDSANSKTFVDSGITDGSFFDPTDEESANSAESTSNEETVSQEMMNNNSAANSDSQSFMDEAPDFLEGEMDAELPTISNDIQETPALLDVVQQEIFENLATDNMNTVRTVNLHDYMTDAAAAALESLEADTGIQLRDDLVKDKRWANSIAYDESEIKILKRPNEVSATQNYGYYYGNDAYMTMSADQEMQYSQCKGLFYVEGPNPEDTSKTMKGFAVKINGTFYGIWLHCGWPGLINAHFNSNAEIERLAAEGK